MTAATALPAQPGLYDAAAAEPRLHGNRCAHCRTGFFPPLAWCCEVCGATAAHLIAEEFDTAGVLWARARLTDGTVVAEIVLDAGPKIRGLLSEDDVAIGQRLRAVWGSVSTDPLTVEPRWSPVRGNA